jgi:hypothetical protein
MAYDNPSFVCIGAQKAGTTWLYANLKSHPDIHLTPLKEVHYFDEVYQKVKTGLYHRITAKEGLSKWMWRGTIRRSFKRAYYDKSLMEFSWFLRFYFFRRSFSWYRKLFDCPPDKISGDITPDYCILDQDTIASIKEYFPRLKILYIIRNPVDRAWSALKMRYVKRRDYALDDIDRALVDDYYDKFYEFNDVCRTLTNWTAFFTGEQFKVSFYDELLEKPADFYNNILTYLGVDSVGPESDDQKDDMLHHKVHAGVKAGMPMKVKKILCEKNYDQLIRLNDYFRKRDNTYPQRWLDDAQSVLKTDR